MSIAQNLHKILDSIPKTVTLVAVTKTQPIEAIQELYDTGYRIFGENKALELRDKQAILPKDIDWHFIGHLQTNKIKYIAPYVKLIHSVDSFNLLENINKEALKNNRVIDCLLQFHIAKEETKFGLSEQEAVEILNSADFQQLKNIRIVGVMGMATFTENKKQVESEFRNLKNIFGNLKKLIDQSYFKEISMGMSDDYKIATTLGSSMIRVGSSIFKLN